MATSLQAARRVLLERFSAADLAVVAIHAELDTMPAFADGRDVDDRVVQVIGAHGRINLKPAKALGLTIPRSVLLRADQVIE